MRRQRGRGHRELKLQFATGHPKFIPHPNRELDLFAGVASLTLQSHFNSQLLKAFGQLGL